MSQASTAHPQAEGVACPKCGAPCPVHPGYTTWCDNCGWNLQPRTRQLSRDSLEELDAELERQHARSAFEATKADDPALPHVSPNAQLLAAFVHLSTFVIAASGLWLIVRLFITPEINVLGIGLSLIFGLGLLFVAGWVQPLAFRKPALVLNQKEHGTLYQLADAVAAALNASSVGGISVNESFDAASSRAGFLQKPFIALGLPLILALNPQELVAAIALALARDSNADPRNNLFIGGATRTLLKWHEILQSGGAGAQRVAVRAGMTTVVEVNRSEVDPIEAIFDKTLRRLAVIPFRAARSLIRASWSQSQISRYRADAHAAQVCGTPALLSLLVKLRLNDAAAAFLQRFARTRDSRSERILTALRDELANVPPRELERIRRTEEMEEQMLNGVNPPLGWRIALLKAHPVTQAKVVCSDEDYYRILAQLQSVEPVIAKRLFERYR